MKLMENGITSTQTTTNKQLNFLLQLQFIQANDKHKN